MTQPSHNAHVTASFPDHAPARRIALQSTWIALLYLSTVTIAELLTVSENPVLGVLAYIVILGVLLNQIATVSTPAVSQVMIGMLLPPILRIVSLSLPLFLFDVTLWYVIISIPLFLAVVAAMRTVGYTWRDVGLRLSLRGSPLQIVAVILGLLFGVLQFWTLRSNPLASALVTQNAVIASLALVLTTGLVEELLFRGIVQQTAEKSLGKAGSVLYASLLYTALNIGWNSATYLLVVLVANVFWGYVFMRTRSIVGIALAHGFANVILFILAPMFIGSPM